jgi:hypothetical protein
LTNVDLAAAIRAGYSKKGARVRGAELLANRNISPAIKKALADRAERCGIEADQVLEELARIGFANAGDYFDWGLDGVTSRRQNMKKTAICRMVPHGEARDRQPPHRHLYSQAPTPAVAPLDNPMIATRIHELQKTHRHLRDGPITVRMTG